MNRAEPAIQIWVAGREGELVVGREILTNTALTKQTCTYRTGETWGYEQVHTLADLCVAVLPLHP